MNRNLQSKDDWREQDSHKNYRHWAHDCRIQIVEFQLSQQGPVLLNLFFFLGSALQHMELKNDAQISKFCSWIFRGTRTAAPHICDFPLHVPDHCVWKPAHHPGCQFRSPPPHPYELLPLQPVLCRRLFHLDHHPKYAVVHPDTEQRYNVWRLHRPDKFVSCSSQGWITFSWLWWSMPATRPYVTLCAT